MNRKLKTGTFVLCVLWSMWLPAQMNRYAYKRLLGAVATGWNRIELPDSLYSQLKSGCNDLRIYSPGTQRGDTLEMPYVLSDDWQKPEEHYQSYRIINRSHNGSCYYFSIKVDGGGLCNRMHLNVEQANFNWTLKLEGSHDQKNWFTLQDQYRLVSIRNELTDYRFCTVAFPESDYLYYRLAITANEQPRLTDLQVSHTPTTQPAMKRYPISSQHINTNKRNRQTVIELNLPVAVPINQLRIRVKDTVDFYRPVIIEYLTDSFRTEKSWYYNYGVAVEGATLSSLDSMTFRFSRCITKQVRITIDNQDNQLLTFTGFELSGLPLSLIARINRTDNCYLCYGRADGPAPRYDLLKAGSRIPASLATPTVGPEQDIRQQPSAQQHPLFENKIWLWLILAVLMVLLTVFSYKMLKKE